MEIITTIENIRSIVNHWKDKGYSIGFVPTMGYLHDGHAALIDQARKDNDKVIVSIFVNPTQFGENEDLNSYPRDINRDKSLCEAHKADIIFSPTSDEMYHDRKAFVNIVELSDTLCGISRPIHFKGVCTVVTKLFNIIQPTNAYFGEKDAQQLAIIRKMVYDLNFPVNIIGVPIVRESDGLAKSSRNTYLSKEERKAATILYKAIQMGKQTIKHGASADSIINTMTEIINTEPLAKIDYVSVVDANTMQPVHEITSPVLVAIAGLYSSFIFYMGCCLYTIFTWYRYVRHGPYN